MGGEYWIQFMWHNATDQLVRGAPAQAEAAKVLEPHRTQERILDCEYDLTTAEVERRKAHESYECFAREPDVTWDVLVALLAKARPGRGLGFVG